MELSMNNKAVLWFYTAALYSSGGKTSSYLLASWSCHSRGKGLKPNDLSGAFQPKLFLIFLFLVVFFILNLLFFVLFSQLALGLPNRKAASVSLQHLSVNLQGFVLVSGVILWYLVIFFFSPGHWDAPMGSTGAAQNPPVDYGCALWVALEGTCRVIFIWGAVYLYKCLQEGCSPDFAALKGEF